VCRDWEANAFVDILARLRKKEKEGKGAGTCATVIEDDDVDGGILIVLAAVVDDSGLLILLANAVEEGGSADGVGLSAMLAMTVRVRMRVLGGEGVSSGLVPADVGC
jgi:hypothetical protein